MCIYIYIYVQLCVCEVMPFMSRCGEVNQVYSVSLCTWSLKMLCFTSVLCLHRQVVRTLEVDSDDLHPERSQNGPTQISQEAA